MMLVGELLVAAALLVRLGMPRLHDLVNGYRRLVPAALPMAGIMVLAFVNTRADALLVGRLVAAQDAGHYLYLSRWVDLAPMLATGVAMPMIAKLRGFDVRRYPLAMMGLGVALVSMPFGLVEAAAFLRPAYGGAVSLRVLLAVLAVCRIGLAVTTMMLLARWHDGMLARIGLVTTASAPLLIWMFGSRWGVQGVVTGALVAEAGNFVLQIMLLLRRNASPQPTVSGKPR